MFNDHFSILFDKNIKVRMAMADSRYGRSRLPELLDRKRMSQVDFAAKLRVTEGFVSQIISGKSKFSLISARDAAKILSCMIEDLYDWNEPSDRR